MAKLKGRKVITASSYDDILDCLSYSLNLEDMDPA